MLNIKRKILVLIIVIIGWIISIIGTELYINGYIEIPGVVVIMTPTFKELLLNSISQGLENYLDYLSRNNVMIVGQEPTIEGIKEYLLKNGWLRNIPRGLHIYFNSIPVQEIHKNQGFLYYFIKIFGCVGNMHVMYWVSNPNNINPIINPIINLILNGIWNNHIYLNPIITIYNTILIYLGWPLIPLQLPGVIPPIVPIVVSICTKIVIMTKLWILWIIFLIM